MLDLRRLVGLLALTLTPATLLVSTLPPALDTHGGTLGLHGVLALSLGTVTATEYFGRDPQTTAVDSQDAQRVLAAALGAVGAYQLSVAVGLGPVLGSALVGVVAALVVPSLAVAAYCGSFVGMVSPAVFGDPSTVAIAGTVAGGTLVAADGVFDGFGGKLGTLALFGCFATAGVTGTSFGAGSALPWTTLSVVVPVAASGAVAASVLQHRFGLGSVLGSALVGVAAVVGLPVADLGTSAPLATVAFCASFVGMASRDRLPSDATVGASGALSGIVFLFAARTLGGAGGKLGTVAFVSCVAVVAGSELRDRVRAAFRRHAT